MGGLTEFIVWWWTLLDGWMSGTADVYIYVGLVILGICVLGGVAVMAYDWGAYGSKYGPDLTYVWHGFVTGLCVGLLWPMLFLLLPFAVVAGLVFGVAYVIGSLR